MKFHNIRTIIPSNGWRAVYAYPDADDHPAIIIEDVVCFALVGDQETSEVCAMSGLDNGELQICDNNELLIGYEGPSSPTLPTPSWKEQGRAHLEFLERNKKS